MTNRIPNNRECPRGTIKQNSAVTGERKRGNKNNLWKSIIKERKKWIEDTGGKIKSNASDKTFKKPERVKKEEKKENVEPLLHEIKNMQPLSEKELIPIVTNLVKNIYSGLNSNGNRELVLSMMPSIFRNTHIRVEKTGKARVKIIIDTEDAFAMNFFNKFYENIKAGLIMRGLMLDEFKIER